MFERFRAHYAEQGIRAEVSLAVHARRPTKPLDFDRRAIAAIVLALQVADRQRFGVGMGIDGNPHRNGRPVASG